MGGVALAGSVRSSWTAPKSPTIVGRRSAPATTIRGASAASTAGWSASATTAGWSAATTATSNAWSSTAAGLDATRLDAAFTALTRLAITVSGPTLFLRELFGKEDFDFLEVIFGRNHPVNGNNGSKINQRGIPWIFSRFGTRGGNQNFHAHGQALAV